MKEFLEDRYYFPAASASDRTHLHSGRSVVTEEGHKAGTVDGATPDASILGSA